MLCACVMNFHIISISNFAKKKARIHTENRNQNIYVCVISSNENIAHCAKLLSLRLPIFLPRPSIKTFWMPGSNLMCSIRLSRVLLLGYGMLDSMLISYPFFPQQLFLCRASLIDSSLHRRFDLRKSLSFMIISIWSWGKNFANPLFVCSS